MTLTFTLRALWDSIKQSPASDVVLGTFPRPMGVGGLTPKACELPDLFLLFFHTQSHFWGVLCRVNFCLFFGDFGSKSVLVLLVTHVSLSPQCPQTPHPLLPSQSLLQQRQQLLLLVQHLQPLPEPELLQLPDEPEPKLEQQQCGGQEPQPEFGPQEQPQQEQEL